MTHLQDTIAAISTAVSESGISIIRISGEDALAVADRVYRSKNGKTVLSEVPTHTIHYGYICDGDQIIDEVLVMVMRGPRTFTAEDTVEIDCHGGVYAAKRVLETVIHAGARPAEPGEFTKRAFLNGRIDLSQAEAVIDVIQAKNEYALRSSISQLRGSLLEVIRALRGEILLETARIEAALDDPEHYSLDGYSQDLDAKNKDWMSRLSRLIDTADSGRIIREGIGTAIVGKPNAGKSSVMNLLTGTDRAIVTDIAGTTRDVLTETITLGSVTLNIMDTAGIRDTGDTVERIGVERARRSAEEADLILYVVDSSIPMDENDESILSLIRGRKAIVLLNKSDLPSVTREEDIRAKIGDLTLIAMSAKKGSGLSELEEQVRTMFYSGEISFNDQVYITNTRQKHNLETALASLRMVAQGIADYMSEDFLSIDLTDACDALGEITGESIREDLANEIFSKFCMGK